MEDNWLKHFVNALNFFPNKKNLILKGNRHANLNLKRIPKEKDKILTIDYLSIKRIKKIFRKEEKLGVFFPMIYMTHGAIAYGGTLLPFNVVVETELPFEPFYLYADDVEYLYRIKKRGYDSYQLSRPIIYDLDQTFSDDTSHLGSYDKSVSLIKLFFMTRNQYALVLMTKSQSKFSVIVNALFGISTKIIFAFLKLGVNKFTIERSKTIIHAVYDGINLKFNNEENIKKYTR
jgi:GT2 family glycosyltransferase